MKSVYRRVLVLFLVFCMLGTLSVSAEEAQQADPAENQGMEIVMEEADIQEPVAEEFLTVEIAAEEEALKDLFGQN